MKNTTTYRQETLSQITNSIQKSNGRTFEDIAKEHDVSASGQSRDVVSAYLHTGISGLEIKKKTRSTKSRITDENRETILSVLFNDPNIFGYIRNTWSLRSLAKCITEEFHIPIN